MDIISSTRNQRVRQVKALQTKARLRRSERKLILEGDRLIADALRSGGNPHVALYTPEAADYDLIADLQNRDCDLLPVTRAVLQHVSDTQQAPGMLAVFQIPRPPLPRRTARALILDGVGEPGNLGAILRTAAAAGVEMAILAPGCVDPYNAKALRAGMGAHFRLPLVEASWKEIAGFCQGMAIYAATPSAKTPYSDANWTDGWALIVGGEAHGLSKRGRDLARRKISIPMSGGAESLNVASAAAVILFEARRQRLNASQ